MNGLLVIQNIKFGYKGWGICYKESLFLCLRPKETKRYPGKIIWKKKWLKKCHKKDENHLWKIKFHTYLNKCNRKYFELQYSMSILCILLITEYYKPNGKQLNKNMRHWDKNILIND